jgi:hypothetical protein
MTVRRLEDSLSMMTRGSTVNGCSRRLGLGLLGNHLADADVAFHRLADEFHDALGAAALVGFGLELALDQQGVERHAVGGGEDLGAGDIGARRGTRTGEQRQQPGMVGGEHRQLGDGGELVGLDGGCHLLAGLSAAAMSGRGDMVLDGRR